MHKCHKDRDSSSPKLSREYAEKVFLRSLCFQKSKIVCFFEISFESLRDFILVVEISASQSADCSLPSAELNAPVVTFIYARLFAFAHISLLPVRIPANSKYNKKVRQTLLESALLFCCCRGAGIRTLSK